MEHFSQPPRCHGRAEYSRQGAGDGVMKTAGPMQAGGDLRAYTGPYGHGGGISRPRPYPASSRTPVAAHRPRDTAAPTGRASLMIYIEGTCVYEREERIECGVMEVTPAWKARSGRALRRTLCGVQYPYRHDRKMPETSCLVRHVSVGLLGRSSTPAQRIDTRQSTWEECRKQGASPGISASDTTNRFFAYIL